MECGGSRGSGQLDSDTRDTQVRKLAPIDRPGYRPIDRAPDYDTFQSEPATACRRPLMRGARQFY